MKTKALLLILLSTLVASCASIPSYLETAGLSPYTQYKTFDTEHFHFIYAEGYFDFAEKAAVHYEHAHSVLQPLLKWTPRLKTNVLIADNEDSANGFTLPSFRVGMVLIATPPETWFSTSYTEDWIKLLVFHEYTHFLNIDATTGWMEAIRVIFGDGIRPNGLWPRWMLEGLAVYFETRTTKLGRGRSPYYESIVRAFVEEGKLNAEGGMTLDRVNGNNPYFPGGEIAYLFGYHLIHQFAKDKTVSDDPEKLLGDYSLNSSSRVPYFIEGNLENTMQRNWQYYWDTFVRESELRYHEQSEEVRRAGETPHEWIAKSDFNLLAPVYSPDGQWLAYTEASLNDRTRLILMNVKTGEKKRLDEKLLGVGLSFTPDSRFLLFSALIREHSYSLYSDLFAYDLKEEHTYALTSGKRAKDPAVSPDGSTLAFLSVSEGTPRIETAPFTIKDGVPTLGQSKVVFTPGRFAILGGPKFLSPSELIFSDQELGEAESRITQTDLKKGSSKVLLKDGQMNRYPTAYQGRIFYVSNRTGIENIYELKKGKGERVTNVITGAVFPFFSPSGELCSNLMTTDGYQAVKFKVSLHSPKLSSAVIALPDDPGFIKDAFAPTELKISSSETKDYSPWSSLAPRQWSPYYLYDSALGSTLGAYALGFDSTGKHQYGILAAYNFTPQTFDGALNYRLYTGRPVFDFALSSDTSVYTKTLNGIELYKRNYAAQVKASYPLLWVRSTLTPSLSIFNDWNGIYRLDNRNRYPKNDFQYQNPYVPGFDLGLDFTDSRTTRLGFMPEMGNDLGLHGGNIYNLDRYAVAKYLANWNHYFGLGNHFVIRSKAQWLGSSRAIDPTLVSQKNSSDLFDRGESLSFSKISFRGYTNTDLIPLDRNAGVAALDFHFPIARFFNGSGGTTPLFIKQTHGHVFGESTYLPKSNGSGVVLPAYGGGISFDTDLLLQLPVRFSLEFQSGTRKDFGGSNLMFFSIENGSLF